MKKKITTYGVNGLMECVMSIPVGKTRMRVEFTGGVLTSYGNTPATFTTKDPLMQSIIEHSPQFKSGRITIVDLPIETDEEVENYVHNVPKAENKDKTVKPSPKKEDEAKQPVNTTGKAADVVKDPSPSNEDAGADADPIPDEAEQKEQPEAEQETAPVDTITDIKVDSYDDAKNYLNEKFGVPVRDLRSHKAIDEKAAEYHIVFHYSE